MSSSYDSALVDTAFLEEQADELSRGERLLRVEAEAWSKLIRSDGFISRRSLRRITDEPDPEGAARALVDAGLWAAAPAGWQIVGFLDRQMSAQRVKEHQEAARGRYDRYRQKHEPNGVSNGAANGAANGESNGSARPPARPPKGRRAKGGKEPVGSAQEVRPPASVIDIDSDENRRLRGDPTDSRHLMAVEGGAQ